MFNPSLVVESTVKPIGVRVPGSTLAAANTAGVGELGCGSGRGAPAAGCKWSPPWHRRAHRGLPLSKVPAQPVLREPIAMGIGSCSCMYAARCAGCAGCKVCPDLVDELHHGPASGVDLGGQGDNEDLLIQLGSGHVEFLQKTIANDVIEDVLVLRGSAKSEITCFLSCNNKAFFSS